MGLHHIRDEIEKEIIRKLEAEDSIPIGDVCERIHGKDGYKNGIYCILDENNNVIYVGMVSNAKNTSLNKRIYEHGSGAHKNKPWFDEASAVRFHRFEKWDVNQLRIAERLVIKHYGQPIYNDECTEDNYLRNMDWSM